MAAPTSYPSYAYNQTQNVAVIVNTVAAFNALGGLGTWTTTPFAAPGTNPSDTGFSVTDTRLQQILVESRVQSQLLQFGFGLVDDPVTQIRPDILANDSGLTT